MLTPVLALLPLVAPTPDAAIIGCWKKDWDAQTILILDDGRALSFEDKPYTRATERVELGSYRVDGGQIHFQWMMSGREDLPYSLEGDTLRLKANAALTFPYHRVGDGTQAQRDYRKLAETAQDLAAQGYAQVKLGKLRPGRTDVPDMVKDVHSDQTFSDPTVFAQQATYQWILTPVRTYEHKMNEPGLTCMSYSFFPNGRFCFDGWLYGILIDDRKPFDERDPVQRRERMVSVKHEQYWGRYRVTPGRGPMDAEEVELVKNDGSKHTVKVVNGRLYLITENPHFAFNNYSVVSKLKWPGP